MNIGIIGLGYVGNAVKHYFENKIPVYSYDINNEGSESSLYNLAKKSSLLFVCLPTPMLKNGSSNIEIIKDVLQELDDLKLSNIHIVVKSTIPVGTTDYFSKKFKYLNICFNPEFLTENNSIKDYENQKRIIIGSNKNFKTVNDFFTKYFSDAKIIIKKPKEAEMIKYVSNTFLAVKVSYANEIFEFCKKNEINYGNIMEVLKDDSRLGHSHWMVPGPDNKKGYGGSCFPKDISSFISQFENSGVEPIILQSSWKRNCEKDRAEKDWTKLIGRSISEDYND